MEPIEKLIGDRLSFARRSHGLTQEQLAVAMDSTLGSVRNWEKARVMPSAEAVAKASRALRVSSDWLLGLTNSEDGLPPGKVMVDIELAERLLASRTAKQLEQLLDPAPAPVVYAIPIPERAKLMERRDADALVKRIESHLLSFPEALKAWRRKLKRR